jgi:ribosomal-protein-alanine N-acetyltransferase
MAGTQPNLPRKASATDSKEPEVLGTVTISTRGRDLDERPLLSTERLPEGSINVRIETNSLVISSVQSHEAAEYHTHLYGDGRVMEKFASGVTRDEDYVKGRIDVWAKRWAEGDPFSALTIRTKDGEFVGQVTMGHGEKPGTSEIAYLIRHDIWNQGFGTEAVRAVVKSLAPTLKEFGYNVEGAPFTIIEATARPDNPASGRILLRCGLSVVSTSEKFGATREHFSGLVDSKPEAPLTVKVVPERLDLPH